MQIRPFFQLGLKHTRNAAAETLYLRTGLDQTRPISFHALVNERCNARCRHCEYWRLPAYESELSLEEWQRALLSIKDFVGAYAINFSGGEPLLKKGFTELLAFCGEHSIHAGLTTNGALLTENQAKKIVAARPFNVNISCDAPHAEVHDYFRGIPGLFDKLSSGIRHLLKAQKDQHIHFPIIIKPTITSLNFRLLPELVHWARDAGTTGINFQPLGRWSPETYDELWIEKESWPELAQVVDRLIVMKHSGAPILNSVENLKLTTANFREDKADPKHMPCRIGLQEYYIRPNGDVCLCFHFPPVGNVTQQSAQAIWQGDQAQKIRRATTRCNKLCLVTCHSQKSLINKAGQALKMLTQRGRPRELALGCNP